MKRRYLKMVRRAYRYLRHPHIRKRPWLVTLTKPLFDRDLWHPCRNSVAGAVSIGLFCAMLPIPFQMLIAALASVRAKANIPISMATCWVTNPFTHLPIIVPLQIKFGHWIGTVVDIPLPFDKEAHIPFPGVDITGSPADFVVGFLVMGVLLSILAYPVVYGLASFLPNRGRRMTAAMRREQKAADDI
ncbi:MAG: DUF2062 domain-containing protein [Verrucomicrobiae bacterium]|nr:DUF2062 domain-containing protein [Verrucomicrobiae bacterium]NNJ42085.1 DUF2062 domain-containing protein [Akkermansiaceae bacterium]